MSSENLHNEEQLAQLIVEGNSRAFRQLFDDLARPLVYFGIRLTGNESEAEDAASEAFQKLWLNRGGMTGYHQIRSYLYTVVRNRCLNYLKRHKLATSIHKRLEGENDTIINKDFADRIVHAETMVIIYRAIQLLADNQREVLYQSYIEERPTSEVAETLGKTEAYVRTTRARALSALRKILKDQGVLHIAIALLSIYQKN